MGSPRFVHALRLSIWATIICCASVVSAQAPDKQQPAVPSEKASAQQTPQRVRVSQKVAQQLVKKKVPPHYPEDARAEHIQDTVLMQVDIDREGRVEKVDLISGHPVRAPAAMEAVRKWKYKPFTLNGQAFPIETQVQINFTLSW